MAFNKLKLHLVNPDIPQQPSAVVEEAMAEQQQRQDDFTDLQAQCDEVVEKLPNPYPNDVWEGTPYAEFAKLCRSEGTEYQNFLPPEFCTNSLMTVVGAICGHRICPDFDDEKMDGRFYSVLLTPRGGSGKGTVFSWATESLFLGTGLLYSSAEKPFKHIGCYSDDFASARGLLDAFMVHPCILQVYEELSTPFEKFGIQGSGTSFKDMILNLFDGTVPRRSVIGKMKIPADAPTRIHNSILGSTTTERGRWDEMFSSSNDDTLRQRMNIIPSTETRTVDIIRKPDFTEFREKILGRIGLLNTFKMVWSYSPEARQMLADWHHKNVETMRASNDSSEVEAYGRIQVYVHRLVSHFALWLAPLPAGVDLSNYEYFWTSDEQGPSILNPPDDKIWNVTVPAEWMEKAIRIAEYQIRARREYTPAEGKGPIALCENLIAKWMVTLKKCRWIVLVDKANLRKFGYENRTRALQNMQREGLVAVESDPADKTNQKKWIVLWTGFGTDKNAVWVERRGGRRPGSGHKRKE